MEIDPSQWADFSRLIDDMLDQPEPRREAWARALAGADAAFAPKLLELLKPTGRTRASTWFDTLPKLSALDTDQAADASQLIEQAGDHVGPYRLERLLGVGGMGSVWYAERTDQLKRRGVALKLPLALANRTLAARFEREREILAGLVHPNIARLYDAGISSSGRAYLALEYVEGQNLDRYCDEHRLDSGARVELYQQVLAAVQHAHSRLVIHRDIKPSNILVGSDGQVRLLDFGVAKLLDVDKAEETDLTRLGGPGMTLAYAAPEQIAGQAVSTVTDVYTLGVVLYELLTGSRPYRLARDTRGALEEAILKGDIPLPSAMPIDAKTAELRSSTPERLRRALRGDLDAILLKALQREPAQRYATVAAFAEDLGRYRSGLAVQAHRPSRGYQVRKFVVRNRLVVGSAAAAACALLAGTGVAIWQAREAQRQESIAEQERDRALSAADHREAVDGFLADLLIDAGRSGDPISVPSLIERAEAISGKEFAADPEARAAVLRTVGEFETELQELQLALKHLDEGHNLIRASPDIALRASVACRRAMLLGATGRSAESDTAFKEVLDDPLVLPNQRSDCLRLRAELALFRGDGPAAGRLVDEALRQEGLSRRTSKMAQLNLFTVRARALARIGQPAKAEADYARVLEELQRLGRGRGELADEVRLDRIEAAFESGQIRQAEILVDEAIRLANADMPGRPAIMHIFERATVLAQLERYSDALDQFNQVAKLAASRDSTIQIRAGLDAADMLSKLGRTGDAATRFQDAVRAADAAPADEFRELEILMTRGKLELDRREFRAALASFSRALQSANVPAATAARINRYRSAAELAIGESDLALTHAHVVLESALAQRGDRPYSFWVGLAQLQLARALEGKGELEPARVAYLAAIEQIGQSAGTEHPAIGRATLGLRGLAGR